MKSLIKKGLCIAAMMSVMAPFALADDPDHNIVDTYIVPNQTTKQATDRFYFDTSTYSGTADGDLGHVDLTLPKEGNPASTVNVQYGINKNGTPTVITTPIDQDAPITNNVIY